MIFIPLFTKIFKPPGGNRESRAGNLQADAVQSDVTMRQVRWRQAAPSGCHGDEKHRGQRGLPGTQHLPQEYRSSCRKTSGKSSCENTRGTQACSFHARSRWKAK